jgi:hypothetical protein
MISYSLVTTSTSTSTASNIEMLIGVCGGSDILINDSNKWDILSISRELENEELYLMIEEHTLKKSITIDNAVSRYLYNKSIGFTCSREIAFISSHFHELDHSTLLGLDSFDFDNFLSDSSLCVASEDSLFDFICDLGFEEFIGLFGFVRFEFLSIDRVVQFCEQIQEKTLSLSSSVLRQLCCRLILPVDTSGVSCDLSRYSTKCVFESSAPLSGIISYLTTKHGGNVSDRNVVTITASSTYGGFAKNAADLSADSCWYSNNEDNSWLRYDFKDMRIKPTHYSVRSRCNGALNDNYPKNWVVEISNDGSTWTTIDERRNNSDLKGGNLTRTFTVSPCDYCRFIQIKQQGPTWFSGGIHYYFIISLFEIFGAVRES